jgi:hypothetical protein
MEERAATEGRPYSSVIVHRKQQLAFNHRDLSVNHSIQIQLAAAYASKKFEAPFCAGRDSGGPQ